VLYSANPCIHNASETPPFPIVNLVVQFRRQRVVETVL
jgi:hypothetical protein